ncbi:MAG: ferric iron uptake transcriptional regulator [Legionellales bacterium]|nr:ferric iron uptake transcriptional regulator [Legionellales bacterium]
MDNQDLRRAGLKVTLPRVKILEILTTAKEHHLSAEDVYRLLQESGEEVSLATIYRVLTQFEQAGLVERHNFEGAHAIFELKPEKHHDHLVCIYCGKVEEFVDDTIERRQQKIAQDAGYRMTDHSLIIYGMCVSCQ